MTPTSCNNITCANNKHRYCKSPIAISIDKFGMCEAVEGPDQMAVAHAGMTAEEYKKFVHRVNENIGRG